jgi:hypothetical protein
MAIVERESGKPDLDELELLWETPARPRPSTAAVPGARARLSRFATSGTALAAAWAVAIAVVGAAPVPAEEADAPLVWWDAVYFFLAVGIVIGLGLLATRLAQVPYGWACSAVAGGLGVILGIACRASGHHLGSWWLLETAAFAAVLGVSVAGAATRRAQP